jgi:hypothetical protein
MSRPATPPADRILSTPRRRIKRHVRLPALDPDSEYSDGAPNRITGAARIGALLCGIGLGNFRSADVRPRDVLFEAEFTSDERDGIYAVPEAVLTHTTFLRMRPCAQRCGHCGLALRSYAGTLPRAVLHERAVAMDGNVERTATTGSPPDGPAPS